jgi:hypothetical protein
MGATNAKELKHLNSNSTIEDIIPTTINPLFNQSFKSLFVVSEGQQGVQQCISSLKSQALGLKMMNLYNLRVQTQNEFKTSETRLWTQCHASVAKPFNQNEKDEYRFK